MCKNKKNLLFVLVLLVFSFNMCRYYRLERGLDAEDAEFLSKVRYIITKEEKKMYLDMPKADRPDFIEEFWKKRDTEPDTEINEFKLEYFRRIDEANQLFSAGKEGWLTDRGQTFILLGPPAHKSIYAMGDMMIGLTRPTEIWHYPDIAAVFIDYSGDGDYEFYFVGLFHQQELYAQFLEAKKLPSERGKTTFNYDIDLSVKDDRHLLLIEVDLANLWMTGEGEQMTTTLEVDLEVYGKDEKKVWEYKKEYPVDLSGKELDSSLRGSHTIEINIDLSPGTYTILSRITNLTDNTKRSKTKIIKIK